MTPYRNSKLATEIPAIGKAAELLRAGRLVAFPTETVYGLGADAR
ncbi:MAG TPA: translation factor Sua5, partial [Alphaproteobacteria bacterium]|nr:translation factor Sua5 [Alphaproteobacteria bacterium]